MTARYWVDAVDGGPKFNQQWVKIRVGLQCGTVYWRWLYFHVVWCLMIAVVSTRIKLLCLLEPVELCL